MTAMFDTLRFARALRDGGQFTPEQAERLSDALSDAIAGEVVSRADLEATDTKLEGKIDGLGGHIAALDSRITALQGEVATLDRRITDLQGEVAALDSRITDMRDDFKAETSALRIEIKGMEAKFEAAKSETIKWVVGIIGFQSVAIVGAAIVLARIVAR